MGYAVVGLDCAAAYENGKAPRLMRSGMIIGAIATVCWILYNVVRDFQVSEAPWRVFVCLTIWPCLMAIIGPLLLLPIRDGWRLGMRTLTIVLLCALGLFNAGAVILRPETSGSYSYMYERVWEYDQRVYPIGYSIGLLASGSLAVTIVLGVLSAVSGRAAQDSAPRLAYWLQCPRCGREQEAQTGDHRCVACNLRAKVELA